MCISVNLFTQGNLNFASWFSKICSELKMITEKWLEGGVPV